MHYGCIKPFTIENGWGVRVSLFVSGCRNRCLHCFQKETWDFCYGKDYTQNTEDYIISLLRHERVDGLTILGGEPFEPENQPDCLKLVKRSKCEFPSKTVWMYTGCVLEKDLIRGKNHVDGLTDELLKNIDMLVDGPFVESLKNLSISFRGSTNQRLIDGEAIRKAIRDRDSNAE